MQVRTPNEARELGERKAGIWLPFFRTDVPLVAWYRFAGELCRWEGLPPEFTMDYVEGFYEHISHYYQANNIYQAPQMIGEPSNGTRP